MPSHYAHYRFGGECIALLPPEEQRIVRLFRPLFDVGLHGPDIFFYRSIFLRDSAAALASDTHRLTGTAVFTHGCQLVRQERGDAARAYLLGLLCHYCLDSAVHPTVTQHSADGSIGHIELETEFDRYLLQQDGQRQPNTYDLSPRLKLTPGECDTAARFYPGAGGFMVRLSLLGMRLSMKLLSLPNGRFRRFIEKGAGKRLRQHFMHRIPNRRCAHLNETLLERYQAALSAFPEMARELRTHLTDQTPLGDAFARDFEGQIQSTKERECQHEKE